MGKVDETAKKLMDNAGIKEDDMNNMAKAAEANYEDFIKNPNKELFYRMMTADLSMKRIIDIIKEEGPTKIFQESQKSDFAERIIEIIGVFTLIGVKLGFMKEDKED